MPIERIGKFLETGDLGITHSLGIETSQLDSCIREIRDRNILGVFGCPGFGFQQDNLNFLSDVPFLKQVWFWDISLKDINGLYSLPDLEYFGVHDKRPAIDFSAFPRLKKAVWQPIQKDSGLALLADMTQLDIWRFKSKDKSYAGIEIPQNLKNLELNWCNPTSLDGLPVLEMLNELQIHYCRNLESIESIFRVAPNLKRLIITRCANLSAFEIVNDHQWDYMYINLKGKTVAHKSKNHDSSETASS